ncbi:MAG: NAD(+) diphosphatase [Thermoanaerobaculia bacterium]|nr:NAD(+) diphosphatase [Thermoanaerobaculia bacterium]
MRRPNVFAGADIDRKSHRRLDETWLATALDAETSRVTLVWRTKNLLRAGDAPDPAHYPLRELVPRLRERADVDATLVFLGQTGDARLFSIDVSPLDDPLHDLELGEEVEFQDLRSVGGLVEPGVGGVLAYARAMATWHRRHLFCGVCGAATDNVQAGHLRRCSAPDCGNEIFPRTDPAVIMVIHHGDLCLLGRQPRWPPGIYSALAGFVEPGESLEDAVRREVLEETGVVVDECTYHSSQPWPFPTSLMLGFHGTARHTDIHVDGAELEEARWVSRDQLLAREVRLPPPLSIARRLIDDWLRGDV